jgi:transposase
MSENNPHHTPDDEQRVLFDAAEFRPDRPEPETRPTGVPRMKLPQRRQVQFMAAAWDDLLPEGHQARIVWEFVLGLDLTPLHSKIKAIEGRAGASAIAPGIMMALWLYATLRGVGSARELDRRCGEQGEVPFRWICGDVSVNYHTLSDFRTAHGEFLDDVLTHGVASLLEQNLVDMERVAQDGMRVRASAGSSSFRRKQTLQECLEEAKAQVEALKAELEHDPAAANRRQQAAQERAARDRLKRVEEALSRMPEAEAKKKSSEKDKARVSTTDPDARVMKMANGGFNPAFNVQFATDTETQIITGVDVINDGSDQGQLAPMVEQHETRYGRVPDESLVDGGYTSKDDIEQVSVDPDDEDSRGTVVYAPVKKSKGMSRDPHKPLPDDSPAVAAWRKRMGTDEAKEIYKERASTAECVNAIARNRGLQQFTVRGLPKVKAAILWYVLAHNLIRAGALRASSKKVS